MERVARVGSALLSLKEIEYLGRPQSGSFHERQSRLIDGVLKPIERQWLERSPASDIFGRVRALRRAIVPEMIEGTLSPQETTQRWKQLSDIELAQAISSFPADYVESRPSVDRILETVERFAENLTGKEKMHRPLHAIVQIGQPIDVKSRRTRGTDTDPLLTTVSDQLQCILSELAQESQIYDPGNGR